MRLQFERGPGQVVLIALMLVAFVIVALARLSSGATPSPTTAPTDSPSTPAQSPLVSQAAEATPSREHRCRGLMPPAPQTTEKQRRHCLSSDHVECAIYRAARDARQATLAAGAGVERVIAADEARRPLPRTAPILLEPPRLLDQASRLQLDRAPGQLALVALMVLAFAIVALSRISAGSGQASPPPSVAAVVPSIVPRTTPPTPIVLPSDAASLEPSGSPVPSFRTTYTVKKGDTLVGVANKFKTTAAAIRTLNNLTSSTLHVGQVLKIP